MTSEEANEEFFRRLDAALPDSPHSVALGASNAPFFLEGGFRFGLYNIDRADYAGLKAAGRSLVLATRLVLPGGNILHLALAFTGPGLDAAKARRDEIAASVTDRKANKVRVYLAPSGVYLAQEDFESRVPVPPEAGAPVNPQAAFFADIEHETDLPPVTTEHVRYLTSLLGSTPFQRLGPTGSTIGGTAVNPAEVPFDEILRRINVLGGFYARVLIERFHAAMNHLRRKHFVLLTGISGTGKTLLAKAYAYAVFGIAALDLPAPHFHLIPVRPDWNEPAHLMGFLDAISGTYQRTRFLNALLQAHSNPHQPTFVCLDEMNLAQPEHYFADVLSAMETGESLHLHSSSLEEEIPQQLPWPDNLYLVGTVNMDETTRPFSPKVLDRANVLDMSTVSIAAYCAELSNQTPELAHVISGAVIDRLDTLSKILSPHGLHFGYRVVEEMVRYMSFCRSKGILSDALDRQIEQKVLTKLRGGPEHRSMLDELHAALGGLPVSQATVARMRDDLATYESFQYWT